MVEYISTIHFLQKQVVSNCLELKFVSTKQLSIYLAFFSAILEFSQFVTWFAGRIV